MLIPETSKIFKIALIALAAFFALPEECYSQLPLITDNTGVQGKGNGQVELSNGIGFHSEHRCMENSTEILPVFTYGLFDKCDLILNYPFLFSTIIDDSSITKIAGFSDINLEVKYQFFKKDHISFALKPGVSFPTGSYIDGLGSGKVNCTLFLILTAEYPTISYNANLGYLKNENRCGDALNIWHASLNIDKKFSKEFHFVFNTGMEKSPDPTSNSFPVFGLLGFYYCLSDNCEFSLGYEHDFIKEETHHSFIYGITLKF
ncbi:MAG: transporter [Bacteroidota bacterium]